VTGSATIDFSTGASSACRFGGDVTGRRVDVIDVGHRAASQVR
jgi:hypothetical protein